MSEAIKLPSWAISFAGPLILASIPVAISWGSLTAQADATAEETKIIAETLKEMKEETTDTAKLAELNSQKIDQLSDSLSDQVKINEQTSDQLKTLINLMIQDRR